MRPFILLVVVVLVALLLAPVPLAAQQPSAPAPAPQPSQTQPSQPQPSQTQPSQAQPSQPKPPQTQADDSDFPVSLERIREGLRKAPERTLLSSLERRPDFAVQIEQQEHVEALLSKLDFSSGPAPLGGLYAYDQQQRLFSPASQPLMQPYAAFSGGQLVTIALQNLIGRYLGGRILNALAAAERARVDREAREEVDQAIAAYCAVHPNRTSIQLCTRDSER